MLTVAEQQAKHNALGNIAIGRLDWVRAQRLGAGYVGTGPQAATVSDIAETLLDLTSRTPKEIYGSDDNQLRSLVRDSLRTLWDMGNISEFTHWSAW